MSAIQIIAKQEKQEKQSNVVKNWCYMAVGVSELEAVFFNSPFWCGSTELVLSPFLGGRLLLCRPQSLFFPSFQGLSTIFDTGNFHS